MPVNSAMLVRNRRASKWVVAFSWTGIKSTATIPPLAHALSPADAIHHVAERLLRALEATVGASPLFSHVDNLGLGELTCDSGGQFRESDNPAHRRLHRALSVLTKNSPTEVPLALPAGDWLPFTPTRTRIWRSRTGFD